jgi:hypothetical protein
MEKTVPLSAFYPHIYGLASTVSEDYADTFIATAVANIARKTGAIVHEYFLDSQQGVASYKMFAELGYSIVTVQEVNVDGVCYKPTRIKPCKKAPPKEVECKPCFVDPCAAPKYNNIVQNTHPVQSSCGASGGTFYVDGEYLILNPAPSYDGDENIAVTMSVSPTVYSCEVPESLLNDWMDVVAHGALMWIFRQKGTKHYDINQYTISSREWERGLKRIEASVRANKVEVMDNIVSNNKYRCGIV